MSASQRSVFLLVISMLIWGSTFVVTKELIAELQPYTLALLRVAGGSLLLFSFAAFRGRGAPKTAKALAGLPWRDISWLALLGVALYYSVFNLSLVYTSASQGALVQSFIPAAVAIVAVLWLRERASPVRWLGIGLSVVGVLIVFSGEAPSSPAGPSPLIGNLLMFASVVLWGVYTSMAKRVAHLDPVVVTAGIMAIGAVMLLPLSIYEVAASGLPEPSPQAWLGLLYLGVGATGLAYLAYNSALRDIEASHAAVYTNLIPIVGVVTGVVVLDEPVSTRAVVGGLIVLAGVWLTGRRSPAPVSA